MKMKKKPRKARVTKHRSPLPPPGQTMEDKKTYKRSREKQRLRKHLREGN